MIRSIRKKIALCRRKAFKFFGLKRSYKFGKYSIKIDYFHPLPEFQIRHPYYDRFLPCLVKSFPEGSVVVDVGANVGDTLVSLVSANERLEFICVEASKDIFPELVRNCDDIKSQNENLQIEVVNQLVGAEISNVRLGKKLWTEHAVVGGGDLTPAPMSSILDDLRVDSTRIALLKTDVDGFDWDVLRSSFSAITHQPYLYFECHVKPIDQYKKYEQLFADLTSIGYQEFAFFDNFGQFILATSSLSCISEMLSYIRRQASSQSTRTIEYYDVLAYPSSRKDEAREIISGYSERPTLSA